MLCEAAYSMKPGPNLCSKNDHTNITLFVFSCSHATHFRMISSFKFISLMIKLSIYICRRYVSVPGDGSYENGSSNSYPPWSSLLCNVVYAFHSTVGITTSFLLEKSQRAEGYTHYSA